MSHHTWLTNVGGVATAGCPCPTHGAFSRLFAAQGLGHLALTRLEQGLHEVKRLVSTLYILFHETMKWWDKDFIREFCMFLKTVNMQNWVSYRFAKQKHMRNLTLYHFAKQKTRESWIFTVENEVSIVASMSVVLAVMIAADRVNKKTIMMWQAELDKMPLWGWQAELKKKAVKTLAERT